MLLAKKSYTINILHNPSQTPIKPPDQVHIILLASIMLSIRSFARSAPRIVPRLANSTVRQPAARQVFLSHSAWRPARTQYSAAFSTTAIRASKAAEGDEELVAKLESEIEMENEMKEEGGVPTSIKDYLENGPFELQDIPGREDVTLTRQFGDET